ncbi:MAG: acetate--CoA ligase, partial [Sphingomonas sp.]
MTAHVHPVPDWADSASMDAEGYARAYDAAKRDPDGYWREQAQRLDWIVPFTTVKDTSFDEADFRIHWFADGQLNVAANCIDRHLATRADQVAILWEGDAPGTDRRITYRELHEQVSRLANALKGLGVAKGDQVTIYLPMIPEAAFAMLACARIGAIHSIVFGGFSPESLANRIIDCDSRIVITADGGCRGGKAVPLKANVDAALEHDGVAVDHVVVVRHSGTDVTMKEGRDQWYGDLVAAAAADCPPEPMGAEDPLFILYTSGSTGKPKGVLHTSGGYLLWASYTHQHVFDYREGEVFWCAADVGWVTGHSYVVYGALANGATTLMYEGVPNYPDHSRFWQIVDKYKVATFYAAPTALRALMREGDDWVTKTDRSSLRVLGSVGEPINPEAWEWFYRVVGEERCPIVDTWWQTETGGHMIAPIPGAVPLKAGSATKPLPGVLPQIVDAEGKVLDGAVEGNLVIADSWPGQMRTVWGDHERF